MSTMTKDHLHLLIGAGVIVGATVIVCRGRNQPTTAQGAIASIAQAANTPPAVSGTLPDYVSYNIAPWGASAPAFLAPTSGAAANIGDGADLGYGGFYSE